MNKEKIVDVRHLYLKYANKNTNTRSSIRGEDTRQSLREVVTYNSNVSTKDHMMRIEN